MVGGSGLLDHNIVGGRWSRDGLLHEPEEQLPATFGRPAVKAEGETHQDSRATAIEPPILDGCPEATASVAR